MPCHAAVCVNCVSGSNVQFLRVITQSTGLAFTTGSLTRDDYGWMLLLCIEKNSVQSLIQCTELNFIKLYSVRSFHSLLTHRLRFEFAVLLFDCERHKEYPAILFLFKGCESLLFILFRAQSFSSEKRVLPKKISVLTQISYSVHYSVSCL